MASPEEDLARYGVAGRSGTTAATADHCVGAIWNPHATKRIFVITMSLSRIANIVGCYVQRITTRGTVGSTITPDIDNDFEALLAPISGAVLDLAAYSAQPTKQAPDYFRFAFTQNTPGSTHELFFGERGLSVPAGTGLGLFQTTAAAGSGDITVVWDE